jgi:hypothetical protein
MTYFLQVGPTSYLPPPPNNAFILWIHQEMNPSIRSEPSESSHLPKTHHLATSSQYISFRGQLTVRQ